MEIYKYFADDYELINANHSEAMEDFFVSIEGNIERKYAEPLVAIFLHKTKREMFLILDCLNFNVESIKKVCREWEYKVLNFVNLGNELRDHIEYLKYNISIIILCKDESGNTDDDFRYETEKSLKICRKIFLLCNDNGTIIDDDTIIPFYFSPVEKVNSSETDDLERELENLLPKDDETLSICDKDKLTSEDIKKLYGWLSEDENN